MIAGLRDWLRVIHRKTYVVAAKDQTSARGCSTLTFISACTTTKKGEDKEGKTAQSLRLQFPKDLSGCDANNHRRGNAMVTTDLIEELAGR